MRNLNRWPKKEKETFWKIVQKTDDTKRPTLYIIFPIVVIVIVISAMFTAFNSVQSYGINIVESNMTVTMTGKTRYIAPPLVCR